MTRDEIIKRTKIYLKRMEKHLSKFANNLVNLAENTADYIEEIKQKVLAGNTRVE